jgi:hypothetical protein
VDWAGLLVLLHGSEHKQHLRQTVSHDKKGASIHSQEQGDVRFRESLAPEDVEDCSVIHSIKGILDVQVQEDRQTSPLPALLRQYAAQFTELAVLLPRWNPS